MAAAAAARVLERLEALRCPLLPPVPPPPELALQFLCTPSSRRLALLEWLCCRVHPKFARRLDALQSGPEERRLRELAGLGAQLMLCSAEDLRLVQGRAPPERQLEFIMDLLDAAPPFPESKDPLKNGRKTLQSATKLLKALLETPREGGALRPPPAPPSFWEEGERPPSERYFDPPCGGGQDGEATLEAQSSPRGGSPHSPPPRNILALLVGAGEELATLATAFGDSELRDPWGGGGHGGGATTPPRPPPCAPLAAPRVQLGIKELAQSLEVVAQLEETVKEISQLAGGGQQQAMVTRTNTLRQRFGDNPQISGGGPRQK